MPTVVRRSEEGANAVEFALLLPVLVVLLFGILFGGLLLNQHLSVTQAAREGARFGATLPLENDAPDSNWFEEVRERTIRGSTGTLSAGSDVVCIWFITEADATIPDAVGNTAPSCGASPPGEVPSSDEGDRVVVYVEQPALLELVLYSFDTTLRSRAVARHEGGT